MPEAVSCGRHLGLGRGFVSRPCLRVAPAGHVPLTPASSVCRRERTIPRRPRPCRSRVSRGGVVERRREGGTTWKKEKTLFSHKSHALICSLRRALHIQDEPASRQQLRSAAQEGAPFTGLSREPTHSCRELSVMHAVRRCPIRAPGPLLTQMLSETLSVRRDHRGPYRSTATQGWE